MYILYRAVIILIGAVLKKIKILGFGGPGLKIHVLKENSYPAPVLEVEGRTYTIFWRTGILKFWGNARKHPKRRILGAFNGFLAGESRLGCRK